MSEYKPNPFGGCRIDSPVATALALAERLKDEVDLIVPLTHLRVPQDEQLCALERFPILLGGHDHFVVDRVAAGTSCHILKCGHDAESFGIVDIRWCDAGKLTIETSIVDASEFQPCPVVSEVIDRHLQVVKMLDGSWLMPIEEELSSKDARTTKPSMGRLLSSVMRDGMGVDMFLLADIRGDTLYLPETHPYLTYRDLVRELAQNNFNVVVKLPGRVVLDLVAHCETLTAAGSNCWNFCYDDRTTVDSSAPAGKLIGSIAGQPFDEERIYSVGLWAMTLEFYRNLVPSLREAVPTLPQEEDGIRDIDLALGRLSVGIWGQIGNFAEVDENSDGLIRQEEVRRALERKLSCPKVSEVMVKNIFSIVDLDHSGHIDRFEYLRLMASLTPQGNLTLDSLKRIGRKVLGAGHENIAVKVFEALHPNRDGKPIHPDERIQNRVQMLQSHTSIQ